MSIEIYKCTAKSRPNMTEQGVRDPKKGIEQKVNEMKFERRRTECSPDRDIIGDGEEKCKRQKQKWRHRAIVRCRHFYVHLLKSIE